MATLPRSSIRYPPGPLRPVSEFDSGINTSTAWTEHLEGGHPSSSTRKYLSESNVPITLSDEEDIEEVTYPARALYKFEGKAEFRELSVEAGDEVGVIKEDVGEGWSLVRDSLGEIGLLPQSYYTLTSELLTPEGSATPRRSSSPHKLFIQNTGEWRGPFQSLLGGKSINRFSSFVTSGAEAFILSGSPALIESKSNGHSKEDSSTSTFEIDEEEHLRRTRLGLGEADSHSVDAGPSWRAKTPPFSVLVHSPSKRSSVLSGAYTIYNVTSIFPSISPTTDWVQVHDPEDRHPPSPTSSSSTTRITVMRRFSHFVMLHTALSRRLPGIALPPLPEKQYAGRFSEDFVEARRGDLERYLNKIVRHPVIRYAEIVVLFLGCENDSEWSRLLPQHLSMPAAGPAFYARVYHPAFNLDLEDAEDTLHCFQTHTKAVGKGIQGLRTVFGRVRESRIEMSKAERLLSYSLLSLITSKPLASTSTPTNEDDEHFNNGKAKGLVNSYGAWCWREGCVECLNLTKSLQKTADTLQTVANLYEGHARRTQLSTHESLKLLAHPVAVYEGVTTTHRSTLTRYREAIGVGAGVNYADEPMATRCETVLNTTMAEMDVYHEQKVEDVRMVVGDYLEGEIALYEQILTRLKSAQNNLSSSTSTATTSSSPLTPIQPSIHEKDVESLNLTSNLNLNYKPLIQPCPHVFDSTPIRPVSVALALQEGVGLFLGGSGGSGEAGGAGVFGKFW